MATFKLASSLLTAGDTLGGGMVPTDDELGEGPKFSLPHSVAGSSSTLGGSFAVWPEVATAIGTVLVPTVDDLQARSTGTALNSAVNVGANAGVATATGLANQTQIFPLPVATIQAVASVGTPTQLVLAVVSTIAATTTLDAIALDGYIVISGAVAGVASLDTPVILTTESNRWTFYDPETDTTYTFDPNPKDETYRRSKNLVYQNTLGPSGVTIIFDRGPRTTELSWSGTIIAEDQYNTFVEWFNKRNAITLTDDLGRSFLIYITEFTPKRERKVSHDWFHTYDMKAQLVS